MPICPSLLSFKNEYSFFDIFYIRIFGFSCLASFSIIINNSQRKVSKLIDDKSKLEKLLNFKSVFEDIKNNVEKSISKYQNVNASSKKCNEFTRKINPIVSKFIKSFYRVENIIQFPKSDLLKKNLSLYKTKQDYLNFLELLADLDLELDKVISNLTD